MSRLLLLAILISSAALAQTPARAEPKLSPEDQKETNERLLKAISTGSRTTAQQLLAEGADPNAADDHGTTALMYAAEGSDLLLINALIKAGANVNAHDQSG